MAQHPGLAPALGLLAFVAAGVAAAGGPSAQLRLRGQVQPVCTVSVADRGVTLDLARPFDSVAVASIEERCNAADGYSVRLSTQNGGRLSGEAGGVPYTISYDGAVQSDGALVATRPAAPLGRSRDLAVSALPPADLPAGAYEDTIVVTIAAR
ncbi:MAG TPA: hypothetical protein VEH84_18565 [Alphaproteobacteria bacterium]|nr:hypothetical protein [Alphaproteobacteria bacterium]